MIVCHAGAVGQVPPAGHQFDSIPTLAVAFIKR